MSDACVERPLDQDLVQQYDAALRQARLRIFSDDGLQSCPPGKLRAMLDEDENTLFLPLASVIDIKKIKELLKNEPDKVEACRAAIDAAGTGHAHLPRRGPRTGAESGKDAGPAGRGLGVRVSASSFFCVFVGRDVVSGVPSAPRALDRWPSTSTVVRAPHG